MGNAGADMASLELAAPPVAALPEPISSEASGAADAMNDALLRPLAGKALSSRSTAYCIIKLTPVAAASASAPLKTFACTALMCCPQAMTRLTAFT